MEKIYNGSIKANKGWTVRWGRFNKMMKHFKMKARSNGRRNLDNIFFNNTGR